MTFKRLAITTLLYWLFTAAIKALFFKVLDMDDFGFQAAYVLLVFIFALAFVRRLGVLNYLEAMFVAALWFFLGLLLDLLFLGAVTGLSMFISWQYWAGYLAMVAAVFTLHKKRHIEIRKEHARQHGGHH